MVLSFPHMFLILSYWIFLILDVLKWTESRVWIWEIIGIFQFLLITKQVDKAFTEFETRVTCLLNNTTEIVSEGHWAGYEKALCDPLYMKWSAHLFPLRETEKIANVCCSCSLNSWCIFIHKATESKPKVYVSNY